MALAGVAMLVSALYLAACEETPVGPSGCSGASCEGDGTILDAGGDGGLDVRFGDRGDGAGGDAGPDEPEYDIPSDCPGGRNACGGCGTLAEVPGDPCGECGDGEWICVGPDEVACRGATETPRRWWFDGDGDGFGGVEADEPSCDPPGESYVEVGGDCDDRNGFVRPGAEESCNGFDDDCDEAIDEPPEGEDCADACCSELYVCEEGRCLILCAGPRCGLDLDVCCLEGQLCWGDSCVWPGDACVFSEDCDIDEICDPSLGICLPRESIPTCEFIPEPGDFSPEEDCRWTPADTTVDSYRNDVVMAPVVANLTDDNEDGHTDVNDTPDIVFITYNLDNTDYSGTNRGCCNVQGTIRIVSGQCEEDGSMLELAAFHSPTLTNDTGIAVGDLNDDGVPEIVAVGFYGGSSNRPQGTIAWTRVTDDGSEWEMLWENTTYPTWNVHTRGGPIISIANLDGEDAPEVIIGNVVLDGLTGELVWDGLVTSGGDGGIGNNAFLGPVSAVGDVDLDNEQEVMAGNTLYDTDGTPLWTYDFAGFDNSGCGGSLPCDGFNAIGNFDDDDYGELVIIRRGAAFVLEHTGDLLFRVLLPTLQPGDDPDDSPCTYNESGPPTVADFDGDGRPEIGTASADYYIVVDLDCTGDPLPDACDREGILWKVRNADCSSRVTGSSVFDFEGDGAAEVVYADEDTFRIFDGRDGTILYEDATHGSHTRIELPVIADVDNDGNAEVVIAENASMSGRPGLEVWADVSDNWVRTRRIWNQHSYSVTNVTENGGIPDDPDVNWLDPRYNNFRQNVQPSGLFDAPDLTLDEAVVPEEVDCEAGVLTVRVTVINEGALSVPAGLPVAVAIEDGADLLELGRGATTERLLPGHSEIITFDVSVPGPDGPTDPWTVHLIVDPDGAHNECDEDNNDLVAGEVGCEIK